MTAEAQAFAALFPPNPMKHGRVMGRDNHGRKIVKTVEGTPVTLQAITAHLGASSRNAGNALGYLPGFEHGTNVGAIDLDDKDFPGEAMPAALRAVLETCAGLNLEAYPERSSSGKGWHVWIFADDVLPWAVYRNALRVIVGKAGLPVTVETYPNGDGASGRWIITPYSKALSERDGIVPRLGATYLELDDGQPIPVDELGEWITRNPAGTMQALAALYRPTPALPRARPEGAGGDLHPDAVPILLTVAVSKAPPARHDAVSAFLNLGARAGDLAGMVNGLKAHEVWRVWCVDGSRTLEQWTEEVDRWADAIEPDGVNGRGLPYLRDVCGYDVPSLPKTSEKNTDGEKEGRKPPAGTRVVEYAQEDGAELWHDQVGGAFITTTVGGHREHYRLPSRAARDYLQALYWTREHRALNTQAQAEALSVMQAIARREGQQHQTAVRVAHLQGRTYLDLGEESWQAVETGPGYWKVIGPHECPVRFTRPAGFLALPVPVEGGTLGELGEFLNADSRGMMMCTAWLIASMSGLSPYPILALNGEQGTGKSTAASALRNLIDPNQADRRRAPKEERDLFIGAQNGHVLSLDNLSSIPGWLSDALCVLSTGGAFTARTLYSDNEETILEAVRPVIVNGIPDLLARPDLAERALTVSLQRIRSEDRVPEKVFWARYDCARPRLVGALLTALAECLRHLESTELQEAPRLADFARLIVAGEEGLPWPAGAFLTAYGEMQTEAASTVLDGEPVAEALRALIEVEGEWAGTVKKLLGILGEREYPDARLPAAWPKTPRALGASLRRLAPALSKTGYTVTPTGRSREGEQYRLSRNVDSTYTTCTTFTEADWAGEKLDVHSKTEVHTGQGNVHTGPEVLIFEELSEPVTSAPADQEEVLTW